MRDNQQWLVHLTIEQIEEVHSAVINAKANGISQETLTIDTFVLPTLAPTIANWRNQIASGLGFVVIRGLPVSEWGIEDSSYAYWGIGHHLGVPGAQNPDNELLGHVVDYGEEAANPNVRRYRTAGNIDFHCDAADVVGLMCLHTAKTGGQSRIVSSVAVFNEVQRVAPHLVSRLFEPFYLDRRGEHKPDQAPYSLIQPCCYTSESGLKTFYHSEYFRSAQRLPEVEFDERSKELLDLMDQLAADPEFYLDMWLEPGDMQFISNHTTMHSRTAYEDWPEAERKRHLLRLWLSLE